MSVRSPISIGLTTIHPSAGTTLQIIQVSASRASAPPTGERVRGDVVAISARLLTSDRRRV
jgi:hypothetical protein